MTRFPLLLLIAFLVVVPGCQCSDKPDIGPVEPVAAVQIPGAAIQA